MTGQPPCAKLIVGFQGSNEPVLCMTPKSEPSLLSQIPSPLSVWFFAVVCGLGVFFFAIAVQWLVYDDWMHSNGPLRLIGSGCAFLITFVFAYRWQLAARKRKLETLRRFETIRWMNDRIRNSLQAIECLVYATNQHVTDPVKDAVDTIETILDEVLSGERPEIKNSAVPLERTRSATHG